MPKVDVTDKGVIDRPPQEVFRAVLNEYAGVTHWMPALQSKLRGTISVDCVGAICDVTAGSQGMSTHFSLEVTKLVTNELIEFELGGDFVGTETWTFEPFDYKTKVQLRWVGATNRLLLSLFSPFVDVAKMHSNAIQQGFVACNAISVRNSSTINSASIETPNPLF
jgi:uncharacterized protein YndB with AHSA1/START domain